MTSHVIDLPHDPSAHWPRPLDDQRNNESPTMTAQDLVPVAVALLIGVPALGSCLGIGLATMKFMESCARQPELMPDLQTKFFLGVGVIDGAFIISTGIGLWFAAASPFR
jgi:F-type H+-transporting ATPase subunit c